MDDTFYSSQGRTGFSEAMNYFMELYNSGKSGIDAMLLLRERFPEDMVDTVLAEARQLGYI